MKRKGRSAAPPRCYSGIEPLELDHIGFRQSDLRGDDRRVAQLPDRELLRVSGDRGYRINRDDDTEAFQRGLARRVENGAVVGQAGDNDGRDALVLEGFFQVAVEELDRKSVV